MKKLTVAILVLLVAGCTPGVVMESVAVPLPAVQPLPLDLPAVPLDALPPLTIPLPGVHDAVMPRSHATERHTSAEEARRAMSDPDNDCQFYLCRVSRHPNSILQLCTIQDQPDRLAVQWLHHDGQQWVEGTSYTRGWQGLRNWLGNQSCRAAS